MSTELDSDVEVPITGDVIPPLFNAALRSRTLGLPADLVMDELARAEPEPDTEVVAADVESYDWFTPGDEPKTEFFTESLPEVDDTHRFPKLAKLVFWRHSGT